MKYLTFLFVMYMLVINVTANDIFIYKNSKNVIGENVIDGSLTSVNLEENSTYTLKNNLSIVTKDDESILYALSCKLFIKQEPDTSVYFNEFFIEFENDFVKPENTIVKTANANFSVFTGELYLIQRAENVNTTVVTTMANINFGEAKLFIKTTHEYTTVYVFDGVVYLYENKGNKMYQVAKGTVVTVSPAPKSWIKRSSTLPNHTFTEARLDSLNIGTESDISSLYSDLQYSFDNTIFISYTDKVFGIKYKKRKTNE